jgi:integrase
MRYKVRFRKPGEFTPAGKPAQGSGLTKTIEEARDLRDGVKEKRRHPEQVQAAIDTDASVTDVMERWLALKGGLEPSTRLAYRQDADGVIAASGDRRASEVDEYEVQVWSERETPGSSKRRKQIVAMKAAFHAATKGKSKLLTVNQLVDVPLPRSKPKDPLDLDWDQLEDLAKAITQHGDGKEDYGPLVWVLGTCGIRLEEAVRLNVEDINWHDRTLFIRKSKTGSGRNRWVPVQPEVLAMLPKAPGPVFRSPTGRRLSSHNWREREWNPVVAAIFEKTVWADLTPHDLRHTAASLAIDSKADADDVANMLGHVDATVTYKIYIHKFEAP